MVPGGGGHAAAPAARLHGAVTLRPAPGAAGAGTAAAVRRRRAALPDHHQSPAHDGDLDLSNNYAAVKAGAEQAGMIWVGRALTHHSVVLIQGQRVHWQEFFKDAKWARDPDGVVRPVFSGPPARPLPPGTPEY